MIRKLASSSPPTTTPSNSSRSGLDYNTGYSTRNRRGDTLRRHLQPRPGRSFGSNRGRAKSTTRRRSRTQVSRDCPFRTACLKWRADCRAKGYVSSAPALHSFKSTDSGCADRDEHGCAAADQSRYTIINTLYYLVLRTVVSTKYFYLNCLLACK